MLLTVIHTWFIRGLYRILNNVRVLKFHCYFLSVFLPDNTWSRICFTTPSFTKSSSPKTTHTRVFFISMEASQSSKAFTWSGHWYHFVIGEIHVSTRMLPLSIDICPSSNFSKNPLSGYDTKAKVSVCRFIIICNGVVSYIYWIQ